MSTLLVIHSSLNAQGQSYQLAEQFAQTWQQAAADREIIRRDLAANPFSHLSEADITAFFSPEDSLGEEAQARRQLSDDLIAEVRQADAIAIAVPMYNFGVPSTLKAWLDRLARAGVTFKYTETGPVGLIEDKPVYLFAARGGIHQGLPSDSQTGFLSSFFGLIGLKSLHFVYAEGLNMGDAAREAALSAAQTQIAELAK